MFVTKVGQYIKCTIFLQIKEEVVADKWSRSRDAEKVLNAKQTQLEQSSRYKEILNDKEEKIQTLQQSLEEAIAETRNKTLEIKHLSNYIGTHFKSYKFTHVLIF